MTRFSADIDQMQSLASRLAGVSSTLQDEKHGSIDGSVLGDGDAVSAMSDFVSGWSTGRSEIVSGVETVKGALHGAAGNYQGTDQGMASKLRAGGS